MKENAPLLIVVAVMLLVVAAILLPDYYACHPIMLVRTAQEVRIETLEAADMHRYVREPIRKIAIWNNRLTVFVDDAPPTNRFQIPNTIENAWEQTYALRHGDPVEKLPCLLLTIIDVKNHESETCETRDSVSRLMVGDCYD